MGEPRVGRSVGRILLVGAIAGIAFGGCRREGGAEAGSAGGPDSPKSKEAEFLSFPEERRVADASVNEFVARAMSVCAGGRYEEFRLLWTAREDPLSRAEFEEGWNAVQRIEVRALEKVLIEADPAEGRDAPQTVYALLADVSFDPARRAGQKEPLRHVVLMIAREGDQWRLARAPKAMREWVKKKADEGRFNRDGADLSPTALPAGP
jgi:hypothetical protein